MAILTAAISSPPPALAEIQSSRFSVGGYFRIMTRPDFQGGDSRLGFWNLYGRLLNEGPWGALEMKLNMVRPSPGTNDVWASVHAKIEGGSFNNADRRKGKLSEYGITQLYVKMGNVLLDRVTWQLGTLDSYFGELGLYDVRPAQILFETLGLSARFQTKSVDLLLGFGDSGYFVRGENYSTVLTVGGSLRWRANRHFELGIGGQFLYEPGVQGNRFAPHATPLPAGVTYEDYVRKEIVARYLEANPNQEDLFPKPVVTDALSYKAVGYLGFGDLGFLRWNNLFFNFQRRHPDSSYTENVDGRDYQIYVKELTDDRYEFNLGNEMHLRLVEGVLDAAWGVLVGYHFNDDNGIAAGDDNRLFYSTVLRLQAYITPTVHVLAETSLAQERSLKGNQWRAHYDSIFQSSKGQANSRGLEYGDLDTRNTWQLKTGLVLNPSGMGIFSRPSIRLLFGLQYSNMHNAFGNSFAETLAEFSEFKEEKDRHWHPMLALEAEAWF